MDPAPTRTDHAMLRARTRLACARSRRVRAVTMIEIMVVMAIIAVITGGVTFGSGMLGGAHLRESSTLVSSSVRYSFSRASAVSKSVRIVFDFTDNAIWVEEGDRLMFVRTNELSGGADPVTDAEKIADQEKDRFYKGPTAPKARFKISEGQEVRPLPKGIEFRSVQTSHDEQPKTEGRAYLYFWPGGRTEKAVVILRKKGSTEEDAAMSVTVSPLTGKPTIERGAKIVDFKEEKGDREE